VESEIVDACAAAWDGRLAGRDLDAAARRFEAALGSEAEQAAQA
jgi:hypothetical protein